MTVIDPLLRSVLENPDDDTVRLAYADHLDETADESADPEVRVHLKARAELIRLQIRALRAPAPPCHWPRGTGDRCAVDSKCPCHPCAAHHATAARVHELAYGVARDRWWTWLSVPVVERGFIERVTCAAHWFVANAADLFAAHPVRAVALSDLEPDVDPDHPTIWWGPDVPPVDEASVPAALYAVLVERAPQAARSDGRYPNYAVTYAGPYEAWAALSDACVVYGRRRAGLGAVAPARD